MKTRDIKFLELGDIKALKIGQLLYFDRDVKSEREALSVYLGPSTEFDTLHYEVSQIRLYNVAKGKISESCHFSRVSLLDNSLGSVRVP